MAGRGPTPKPSGSRSRTRDDRRRVDDQTLELDVSAAPAKARVLPGARDRHPRTRRWWRVAATSPQAANFIETDWLVLERLADLYDAWFGGNLAVGNEIRLCEAKLGFTPEDRLRLRWKLSEQKRQDERGDAEGEDTPSPRGRVADPRLRFVKGGAA